MQSTVVNPGPVEEEYLEEEARNRRVAELHPSECRGIVVKRYQSGGKSENGETGMFLSMTGRC